MGTPALIGFGDADSFYASAEAARRPWMAGLPVGVLGNQGACVIARNYPMKKYGVKVGQPVWEAKELCPNGVYVKRDFRWYETLSRRMLAEINTFSPRVEYFSIDEFFWQGEPLRGRTWKQQAEAIKGHIKATVGVPMTVAFARTRTLAKLFADTAKPNGAVAVTDEHDERELLARLPITEIAGIGGRRAAKLEPYGIKTCLDYARACGHRIKKLLTVVGHDIWLELRGIRVHPIRPARSPHKMIARGGSLAGRVSDPQALFGWLVRNVERLIEELHYHEVRPRVLSVYLAYHDAPAGGRSLRLTLPSDQFADLLAAAKVGLRGAWRPGLVATHMHVVASELVRPAGWARSLFDADDPRADTLARLKREVNDRFGRFKLRSGATLYANDFYRDKANEYDICDVRGKFCF
jgi:DNA polymerase V